MQFLLQISASETRNVKFINASAAKYRLDGSVKANYNFDSENPFR
jgi:hypothetical protein